MENWLHTTIDATTVCVVLYARVKKSFQCQTKNSRLYINKNAINRVKLISWGSLFVMRFFADLPTLSFIAITLVRIF